MKPEDWTADKSQYLCTCCVCGKVFSGYKRRVVCKVCYSTERDPISDTIDFHND